MSNLASADTSALTVSHERTLCGPTSTAMSASTPVAVPVAKRVFQRPCPPPSQSNRAARVPSDASSALRLPMRPRPLEAPPVDPNQVAEPRSQTHAEQHDATSFRRFLLVGALATAMTIVGVLVGAYCLSSEGATAKNSSQDESVTPSAGAEEENQTASQPDATTTAADWQPYTNWEDLLDEPAAADAADDGVTLTGKSLLGSRFYEMDADSQGHIVNVRMPTDGHNRRFGPTMDEIAALNELPHLQRLDFGDTIATAAVPIANRQRNVKVLVLENQSDAKTLRRLRHVEELHLKNSSIDATALAGCGIRLVQLED